MMLIPPVLVDAPGSPLLDGGGEGGGLGGGAGKPLLVAPSDDVPPLVVELME